MKRFLKKHPYLRFLLWSAMLPLLSVVLGLTYDAYNPTGQEELQPFVCGIVNVTWPLWWMAALAHVFGVTELVLYGIFVKDDILETLGMKRVLLTALIAAMGSYCVLCCFQFSFYKDRLFTVLRLGTVFAGLPALAAVLVRYGLWQHRKTRGR